MKEEGPVDKSFYTTNIVNLFSFYIPKPQSLTSRSDLKLIICYQILHTLNHTFYYTNCFVYALEQYGVPSDKLDVIRSYLVSIYVKIKDIGYLGKLLKLWFIIHLARDHINEEYRLIKLGKLENKYIISYKSCQKSIPLFIYEYHLMLYNVNIKFNERSYMNTWHLLETLIKDNTIVRMIIDEKTNLNEYYWKEVNQTYLIVLFLDQIYESYNLLPWLVTLIVLFSRFTLLWFI